MADAGARQIRALLTAPAGNLEANLEAVGEAIPEDDNEAQAPDSVFRALRAVRRSYGRLGRQVRAIKTSEPAKGDVLDALRGVDAGLKLYARGLREPDTDEGRQRIADGAFQVQDAASALAGATRALA